MEEVAGLVNGVDSCNGGGTDGGGGGGFDGGGGSIRSELDGVALGLCCIS